MPLGIPVVRWLLGASAMPVNPAGGPKRNLALVPPKQEVICPPFSVTAGYSGWPCICAGTSKAMPIDDPFSV